MAICDDSVKTNLVQVGGLKLQHLVDTSPVDRIGGIGNLLRRAICTAEAGLDELLAVLVQKVEGVKVSASGDLDQLCKSVSDLSLGKRSKESEVEEGVHWCVVGTQAVFVVAVVDSHLDRDRGVDQTNDGSGDTDEVGVSAVRSTSKSVRDC